MKFHNKFSEIFHFYKQIINWNNLFIMGFAGIFNIEQRDILLYVNIMQIEIKQ